MAAHLRGIDAGRIEASDEGWEPAAVGVADRPGFLHPPEARGESPAEHRNLLAPGPSRCMPRLAAGCWPAPHARSGDPAHLATYPGSGDRFDRAMGDFAEAYANQNEHDYRALATRGIAPRIGWHRNRRPGAARRYPQHARRFCPLRFARQMPQLTLVTRRPWR